MLRSSTAARMLSMLGRSTTHRLVPGKEAGTRSFKGIAPRIAVWAGSSARLPGQRVFAMPGQETGGMLLKGSQWRAHSHGHSHGHSHDHDGPSVKIKFVYEKDKREIVVDAPIGMNVLRVAQAHEVELEGACECSLACSTCHVVLEDELFDSLEEPTDDENDMLDLAFALTDTSRLGCQIIVTEDMEGAVFKIPTATRNMYVDGHVPKPH